MNRLSRPIQRGLNRLGYEVRRLQPVRPTARMPGVDAPDETIIRAVKPFTMTSTARLHALIVATRHIVNTGVEGAVVECGVWKGGSMMAAAMALLDEGQSDRDLFLFDTYEGMTPPSDVDRRRSDGALAAEILAATSRDSVYWAVGARQDVERAMASTGYPRGRLHFVVGKVEHTIPEEAPETIALLRLDTDWYESTRHELEHLWDRVSSGGVLIIDDYGHWEGARRAVDEFFDGRSKPLLAPADEGRIAVKA